MPGYPVRRPSGNPLREAQSALSRMLGRDPTADELVSAVEAVQPSAAGRGRSWKNYYALVVDAVGGNALAAGTANARPTAQTFANFPVRNTEQTLAISTLSYVATDPRIYAKILDQTYGTYFQLSALDLMGIGGYMGAGAGTPPLPIFGTTNQAISFVPYIFDAEYILAGRANLIVQLADFSAAANPVRLVLHGGHLKAGPAPWEDFQGDRIPFWLTLPPDDINPVIAAANGFLQTSAPLDDQGDFVITKISAVRSAACSVRIQDAYDSEWFSSDIHVDNLAGNGSFPHRLPARRLVPSNQPIRAKFTDLSGNPNTFVRLTLHGYRLLGQRTAP